MLESSETFMFADRKYSIKKLRRNAILAVLR